MKLSLCVLIFLILQCLGCNPGPQACQGTALAHSYSYLQPSLAKLHVDEMHPPLGTRKHIEEQLNIVIFPQK